MAEEHKTSEHSDARSAKQVHVSFEQQTSLKSSPRSIEPKVIGSSKSHRGVQEEEPERWDGLS